jgi:hypothetical protein
MEMSKLGRYVHTTAAWEGYHVGYILVFVLCLRVFFLHQDIFIESGEREFSRLSLVLTYLTPDFSLISVPTERT